MTLPETKKGDLADSETKLNAFHLNSKQQQTKSIMRSTSTANEKTIIRRATKGMRSERSDDEVLEWKATCQAF
jgi:hypothetical protein